MLEAIGSEEVARGNKCSCGIAGLAPRLHFESFPPIRKVGRKRRTAERNRGCDEKAILSKRAYGAGQKLSKFSFCHIHVKEPFY